MFTRTLTCVLGFGLFLQAQTLQELINTSFEKNYELNRLQTLTKSYKLNEKISTKLTNPTLGLGMNDILFNSGFERAKEPMQTEFVTISQKLPISGRLGTSEKIAKNDTNSNLYNISNIKNDIASKVYELGYKIVINNQEIEYLQKYYENLEKLKEYSTLYYEQGLGESDDLIELDIKKENLNINISSLKIENEILNQKLERIVNEKVDNIQTSLDFMEYKDSIDINNHPKILLIKEELEKQNNNIELEKDKRFDDVTLNMGYYHRSDYDDYLGFSVGIPLPIYGSENLKIQKASTIKSSLNLKLQDIQDEFDSQVKILELELKRAKQNYNVIESKILRAKESLNNLYVSTNEVSNKNRQIIINENNILDIKLKALDWKRKYFTSYAKLVYFRGME